MKARPQPKKNVVLLSKRPNKPAVVPANKIKPIATPASKVVAATSHHNLSNFSQNKSNRGSLSAKKAEFRADWSKLKRGGLIALIILALAGASYGLFISNYFRADNIAVQGAQLLDENELQAKAQTALAGHFWQIGRTNFWLATSARFCRTVQDYNLAGCHLKKQWPNRFTLKIQEEPTVAIWQENGWYYWIDRFGRVAKQELPNPASAKLHPVINNTGSDSLVSERRVTVNSEIWPLIAAIGQKGWLGQAPRSFNFNNQEPNSLQAVTASQQVVKLTLRSSLADQMKLWQSGQSKFAQQLSQAKVIDLRYGDRIIYQ